MTQPRCPKCDGALTRSHGEVFCLRCGREESTTHDPRWVEPVIARRNRAAYAKVGTKWTPDDLAFLLANKDRLSAKQIGEKLDRPERAVHHKLSQIQTKKRRVASLKCHKPENLADAVARPQQPYSQREQETIEDSAAPGKLADIAAKVGRSYDALRRQLSRWGIRAREHDGLMSPADVAREFHLTERTVRNMCDDGRLTATRSGTWWRIDRGDAEKAFGRVKR